MSYKVITHMRGSIIARIEIKPRDARYKSVSLMGGDAAQFIACRRSFSKPEAAASYVRRVYNALRSMS